MPVKTRIITITAARTYVGQHTIEIPDFCRNERFRNIVAQGGSTARFLGKQMVFGRLLGTGLARPVVSDAKGALEADFLLSDVSAFLRDDGFIF